MNRRFCVWVVAILCLSGGMAMGQSGPAGLLAAQGATPESPANIQSITAFIKEQYQLLSGKDPTAISAARIKLISQIGRGSTPAYYSAFADIWSKTVMDGISKNPPTLSVRINIGLVTSVLTDNGSAIEAEPLVALLLKDAEPSVSLVGIKAARPLIGVLLALPNTPKGPAILAHPVVGEIVNAVKRHQNSEISGFIAVDAYSALAFKSSPALSSDKAKGLVPPLVGPILDVLEIRLDQYKTGAVQSPGAERDIGTFLSSNRDAVAVNEQKRIVTDLVNLVTFIGVRAKLYESSKEDAIQVRGVVQYVASALKVIVPNQASAPAMQWLGSASSTAPVKDLEKNAGMLYTTVQQDPDFKWLPKPPAISDIQPPPPPAPPAAPAGAPAGTPPG